MRGLVTGTVPGGDNATPGTPVVSPLLAVQLEADVLDIQTLLLSSGDAVSCGGTSVPSTPAGFPLNKVISSDNTRVTFHVSFPVPRFSEKVGDGVPYTQVLSPGMGDVSSMFSPGKGEADQPEGTVVGLPQLPVMGEEIALPQGGSAVVQVLHTSSYLLPAVEVWPLQPGTRGRQHHEHEQGRSAAATCTSVHDQPDRVQVLAGVPVGVGCRYADRVGARLGGGRRGVGRRPVPTRAATAQGANRHGGPGELRREQSECVRDRPADDAGRPPVPYRLAVEPAQLQHDREVPRSLQATERGMRGRNDDDHVAGVDVGGQYLRRRAHR